MALLSVTLVGITDNIIVYQFIMLPVGVLVGISLRPDPGPASNAQLHGRWNWETRSGMLRLRFSTLLDRGPGLARLRGILGGMSDSAFSALSTFTVGLAAVRMLPDSGVALFSLMLTGYVIGQILPRNLVLTHIELSANRSATVYLPSMRDSLLRAKVPLGIAFVLTVASGFPAAGHVTFRQYLAMALGAGAASLSGAILTHMRASMHLVKLHEWAGTAALVNFMSTVAILVGGHLVLPARAVWALPFGALAGGQIAAMLVWRAAAARVSVRHAPPLTVLGSRLLYLVPIGAAQLMIYTQSTIILSALGTSASAHLEGARVAASPIYVVASGLGVLVIPPLVRGLASRTPAQTLAGLTRGMAILIGCGVAYAAALVGFGPAVSAVLGREIDTLLASVRAVAFSVDGTISMNLGILIALDEFARPAWLSTGTAVLGVCVTLLLVPSLGLYSVPVGQLLAVTTQLAVGIVITRGALRRRLGSTPTAS